MASKSQALYNGSRHHAIAASEWPIELTAALERTMKDASSERADFMLALFATEHGLTFVDVQEHWNHLKAELQRYKKIEREFKERCLAYSREPVEGKTRAWQEFEEDCVRWFCERYRGLSYYQIARYAHEVMPYRTEKAIERHMALLMQAADAVTASAIAESASCDDSSDRAEPSQAADLAGQPEALKEGNDPLAPVPDYVPDSPANKEKYHIGQVLEGCLVKSVVKSGINVALPNGSSAFVALGDISNDFVTDAAQYARPGDRVGVMILGVGDVYQASCRRVAPLVRQYSAKPLGAVGETEGQSPSESCQVASPESRSAVPVPPPPSTPETVPQGSGKDGASAYDEARTLIDEVISNLLRLREILSTVEKEHERFKELKRVLHDMNL